MADKQVENIRNEQYVKQFQAGENRCKVMLEDAYYGDWKGVSQVMDKSCVDNMFEDIVKAIAKHTTKYNPMPVQVSIRHKPEGAKEELPNANAVTSVQIPRYSLEQVILPEETKEQLEVTLSAICHRERLNKEWGLSDSLLNTRALVLNFYGYAGTGKSMTAEAIAEYLDKKCLIVNYSELESKYVGETPKNIKRVFTEAMRENAVLVFDEADSFLGKRLTNITQSSDYGVNITRSVMLMELERFEGVVVFTTNLIENYDTAFKRRIFANIEFKLPDESARTGIWNMHIGSKLPLSDEVTPDALAKKYESVSGADIKDIVYYAALYAMSKAKKQVETEDFKRAYEHIMKRYA